MTTDPVPLPLPEGGPTDITRVVTYARIKNGVDGLTPAEQTEMDDTVAAINEWVRGLPVADAARGSESWPSAIVKGATMMAGRLWRRRDTNGGIYSAGDVVPIFVHTRDPDVALLLKLGDYGKPSVL